MSHHSQSSSEIETPTLRDVLPKFFKDFKKDFCFDDVKDAVEYIFTEEEMRLLLAETNQKKRILQLFWILYDKEDYIIDKFLSTIQIWYKWLTDMVHRERDIIASKSTEQYIHAVRALRSDFQKHLDYNVHRMEYYWPIRSQLKSLKPYNYLVLSGELGVGKKWLAVDVCSEYAIMKAMGLNIFWLDVHNCNSREEDFRALQQFRLLIGESDSTTTWHRSSEFDGVDNKILHLQQYIRDRLQQDKFKDCLLILSDVQNSKTLKTFNLGCKVLIITRNRRISESLSKSITVHIAIENGLTTSESFQLFEKVLQRKRSYFPKEASDIFIQSGGHPYLLTIIANNLKLNKQRNWTDWIRNLQNLHITNNKFTMIVEISLKVLEPEEMELYKMLAIFTHSVNIPLKLLAMLWNKNEHDAKHLMAKFHKYSIINRQYVGDETVAVLPYVYSSYLKADKDINRTELHAKVVSYYRIAETLENRTEVDLFCRGNDHYFYHCIGYHMREAGCLDLFPKLFLDFGFLGEKLRSDGFPYTIGDLKYFRKEITGGDSYRDDLVSKLLDFLPSIEEMLFRSKDTCLLQYALMANGLVREEAKKQAKVFYNKMWFNEKGHFHQRRQMVCLPNKPKLLILPEPDTCLIALDNNDILLVDLSLDYNNGPVYLTDNEYTITKMQLILQDNYIITLDKKGNFKVWSITDHRRRSASRKGSRRTKVNPLNLTQCPQMLKTKCKQLIPLGVRGAIHTFYVESFNGGVLDLHLAFANGDICQYSWNAQREQFELKSSPIHPTKASKISYLSKILENYYLVMESSGTMYIYNLRDGSEAGHSFDWPKPPNVLYVGEFLRDSTTHIVSVCRDKVLSLTLPRQTFKFLAGKLETVFNINENDSGNVFTCARLSRDGCYLVLGTRRGLIIYDTKLKSEVLRGNISESIACVDIYPLDDNVFKYIVVCGSEESTVLNLFALRLLENNTIAWSHRLTKGASNVVTKGDDQSDSPQFEPDVWLQGNKLFDLNYSDSVRLVAVDSKNRIHQLSTTDEKTWLISLPPETSRQITAITSFNCSSYCAFDNGDIFNITQQVFETSFTSNSITFLQLIDENTLVVSSKDSKQSLVRAIDADGNMLHNYFSIDLRKCFAYVDTYLILVDPICGFIVVDLKNKFAEVASKSDVSNLLGTRGALLGGCDLKSNYLLLATVHFEIFIYEFSISDDGKLNIEKYMRYRGNCEDTDRVTCVTSSADASLFAVGLKSGTIEVYEISQKSTKFIFRLLSHTSPIYDLKFSPNTEILVSCSEQLCFWHVSYILNNPFDSGTKQKRRSSRFTSSHSPVEQATHALGQLCHYDGELPVSPWANKCGPLDKPELLSCIKFVGNKAEIFYANKDFTQFNTIDNEGVYYHLCVHDISQNVFATNGNGHSPNTNLNGDDDVIA